MKKNIARAANWIGLGWLALIAILLSSNPSSAGVTLITNVSQAGSDVVDWGQVGPALSSPSNPSTAVSSNGITVYVTSQIGLKRLDEVSVPGWTESFANTPFGWAGNFIQGDQLLWSDTSCCIQFQFTTPIQSFETQIQLRYYSIGGSAARITAYDTEGYFLESFIPTVFSNQRNDGSADIIGVESDSANIGFVSLQGYFGDDFAINELHIGAPPPSAVPEPSTWTMLLLGFFGVGFMMRRQREVMQNV